MPCWDTRIVIRFLVKPSRHSAYNESNRYQLSLLVAVIGLQTITMPEPKSTIREATAALTSGRASDGMRSIPNTSLLQQRTIESWLEKFKHRWHSSLEYKRNTADIAKGKQTEEEQPSFVVAIIDGKRGYILRWLLRLSVWGISAVLAFFALYYAISAPPLHLFYEVGEAADPASVYVPGGGFSGFWFHLGYLHTFGSQQNMNDYDYYCFSAGCLSEYNISRCLS